MKTVSVVTLINLDLCLKLYSVGSLNLREFGLESPSIRRLRRYGSPGQFPNIIVSLVWLLGHRTDEYSGQCLKCMIGQRQDQYGHLTISVFIENMGNFKYETIYFLEWKSKKGHYLSVFTRGQSLPNIQLHK